MSVLRSAAQVAASIAVVVFATSSIADAADKLRVAKPEATSFSFAFLDVGVQTGIFAKHEVEIESIDVAGGSKANQALIAGSIDIELGSGIEMLFIVKGSPEKGIAVLAGPPLSMGISVRDDSGIKDIASLKGKAIGISTAGSLTDWLAEELSRRQGWGTDGVRRVALGSQDALSAALIAKNVDAIIGGTPTAYRLQEAGQAKVLATFGPTVPDFITNMIFASNAVIAAHPEAVRHFLAGWFETVRFAKANKEETIRLTRPATRLSPEIASIIYDEQMPMFSTDGRFDPKAVAVVKNSIKELSQFDSLPPDDVLFTEAFLPPRQ